jgi:hypothetical protein
MMEPEKRKFLEVVSALNHEAWLTIMKFGLPEPVGDQRVLIEAILTEAKVEASRRKRQVDLAAFDIIDELGLSLVPAGSGQTIMARPVFRPEPGRLE